MTGVFSMPVILMLTCPVSAVACPQAFIPILLNSNRRASQNADRQQEDFTQILQNIYYSDKIRAIDVEENAGKIAIEVDDDPRAKYFDQVQNGRFMRMALILKMLGLENEVEK